MQKGLFIGMGGAGVATVARLKALLFQRAYGFDKTAMDNNCSFIFYDTDPGSVRQVLSDVELKRMMGNYPVVDLGTEFINAGVAYPYQIYQAAKQSSDSDENSQRLLEWAIDPDVQGHYMLPKYCKELRALPYTSRMAGRTAFYFKKEEIEQTIVDKLRRIYAGREQIPIWVFSSSLGFTSSGALLDMLYLVDRLYKTHVVNCNPYLHLVLYMPKAFIDRNQPNVNNYALNAYSTLWELNAFRADAVIDNDGKKFGAFAVQPDREEWSNLMPWQVCSWVLAVDTESNDGRRMMRLDQMYANTAETCYFMHTGAAGQTMADYLDNDFAPGNPFYGQYKETRSDAFKWSNCVIGSGFKTINKADYFLKEYVRRRFRYDLYGYGLIGLDFNKILPNEEDRLKAAKAFATEYIMDHLVNIDRFGMSARNSLYGMYEAAFSDIIIPSDNEVPSKDDWFNMGECFVVECKVIAHRLEDAFDDPSSSYSKTNWLGKIEQSVKEGLEKCIVNFGLNYAYSLISMVDDDYLEREVQGRLRPKDVLRLLEHQIEDIIQTFGRPLGRRKGIVELVATMNEYKKACIDELAINHIRTIIQDLTYEKTGFLYYLRNGDQNHMGIGGLIRTAYDSFGASKAFYQDLALSFSKTSSEVCTDYFPRVYEFVETGEAWKKDNLFEQLYSSIVPVDSDENAEVFESLSLGCPPLRELGDKGLAPIICEIKNRIRNHNFIFSDMVLCHPIIHFPEMFKDLMEQIDVFIEQAINDNTYVVKHWLDKSLESVFDESFVNEDGIIDMAAKREYCNRYSRSVPVFYPIAQGAMTQVETRRLYVGNNLGFAIMLGYNSGNPGEQFVRDANQDHRLIVFKYEVGHNFYDYKYFDMLNRIYEDHREQIEHEAIGCHIHKEFVRRDIGKAYKRVNSK